MFPLSRFCAVVNVPNVVAEISVASPELQTPVAGTQATEQLFTVTTNARTVPVSDMRVDVPDATAFSDSPIALRDPLFVSVTYLLATSPGARFATLVLNPAPLLAKLRLKVPEFTF
jgi:hypothetical protein